MMRARQPAIFWVVVMGGGYGDRVEDTVDVHETTVRTAYDAWARARIAA